MDKLLLNSYLSIYIFSEVITLILSLMVLFITVKIVLKWDFNSNSKEQYALEKSLYLGSILALFLFVAKLILLVYLVYALDAISIYIPGAMCAAGVVSANGYGMVLLGVKFLTIFMLLLYLFLEKYDVESKYYPILRAREVVLIVAIVLSLIEVYLDYSYFYNIDINAPVSCCSTLYGTLEGQNPLPFNLNINTLLIVFALLFIALISALLLELEILTLIVAPLFIYISYYSVVYFFGTYIYQLPTHKCPFCMMQKEYNYIGYLVWGTLFFGVSLGAVWAIVKRWLKKDYREVKRYAIILLTLFVAINCSYILIYYIKNGVLL